MGRATRATPSWGGVLLRRYECGQERNLGNEILSLLSALSVLAMKVLHPQRNTLALMPHAWWLTVRGQGTRGSVDLSLSYGGQGSLYLQTPCPPPTFKLQHSIDRPA